MRLLVRATIESDAYGIIEAGDGDEAWVLIQQHRPSLVILDIQMPGRTGLEILTSLKSDPALKATHVIVLTARALRTDVEAGIKAGADCYLTKPFSPFELIARIEEALGPVKLPTANGSSRLRVRRSSKSA